MIAAALETQQLRAQSGHSGGGLSLPLLLLQRSEGFGDGADARAPGLRGKKEGGNGGRGGELWWEETGTCGGGTEG